MKHLYHDIRLLLLFLSVILLSGCVKDEEFTNDSRGNFEALWRIMDEHYCFFSEKSNLGLTGMLFISVIASRLIHK